MSDLLKQFATDLGIATTFNDAGMVQRTYNIDDDTLRFFISKLGYACGNDAEISASMEAFHNQRYQDVLAPIYVCKEDNVTFDIVHPQDKQVDKIAIKNSALKLQDVCIEAVSEPQTKDIAGTFYVLQNYKISTKLEPGYYELDVKISNKNYKSKIAVAPSRCYHSSGMDNKLWGYAIQLYAVKSQRNWGVGDFTDLSEIIKMCAKTGANIIGLNPLNVLCHDFPENASPYQSISRLFLNPIYIDVEKVPEYRAEDIQMAEGLLADVKTSEYIQYSKVYPLKVKMLEKCFKRFQESVQSSRMEAYKKFCKEQGEDLDKLALFQALYESESPKVWGGWRAWPEEYKSPQASGIPEYIEKHQERIEFFKFMQFEANRQFSEAQKLVKDMGLKIGLYRDLAVGVGKDSAEYWGNHELFIPGVGAGAPPDAFFTSGQRWGLAAFSPTKLKEHRYEPFIKILRANMKNAGALRMDHVMSLMRLYLLDDESNRGTYLYYNFADMLNIVALESYLNKCVIVGESIGNVPEGFLDTLKDRNILSLSVLWSERAAVGWGGFYAPHDYTPTAFASVGTHDMPPLKMWWYGYDIAEAYNLGLISSEQDKNEAYHKRETDRGLLLSSIDAAGVWPEDRPRQGNYIYGENYPEGLEEAVHRYVARSSSVVFLAQLEDFLHVTKQQNLPGTDIDKHLNWRLKLPVSLENMETDPAYIRNVAAIRKER